jgi:hypothetical protein
MVHSASGHAVSVARPKVSRTVLLGAWGLLLVGVLAAGALRSAPAAPGEAKGSGSGPERGKYLVTITGCNDCHTPRDTERLLSGHPAHAAAADAPSAGESWSGTGSATAVVGPWGVRYASNLTPDHHTGIGLWSEQRFVAAMRTGWHMASTRADMPSRPGQHLGAMTDQDLAAVYAYLRTLPPIRNRVPPSVLAEPPAAPGG